MWDISASHPLVIRTDSYSHYPASRQTSKLSILKLNRKLRDVSTVIVCVCVCVDDVSFSNNNRHV